VRAETTKTKASRLRHQGRPSSQLEDAPKPQNIISSLFDTAQSTRSPTSRGRSYVGQHGSWLWLWVWDQRSRLSVPVNSQSDRGLFFAVCRLAQRRDSHKLPSSLTGKRRTPIHVVPGFSGLVLGATLQGIIRTPQRHRLTWHLSTLSVPPSQPAVPDHQKSISGSGRLFHAPDLLAYSPCGEVSKDRGWCENRRGKG
jgi:hypothetical protein